MTLKDELKAMCRRLAARAGIKSAPAAKPAPVTAAAVFTDDFSVQRKRESKDRTDALKALGIILDRCLSMSGRRLELRLDAAEVSFEFKTPEGKTASGNISSRVKEALAAVLNESQTGPASFNLPSGGRAEGISVQRQGSALFYRLRLAGETDEVLMPEVPVPEVRPQAPQSISFSVAQQPEMQSESGIVLIVDDNLTFARVLEKFLSRQGLKARHVENGRLALKLLSSGEISPEMVVCDVHMPEMNGISFVKAVREELGIYDLPFIMLTSDDDVETEIRLLSLGADVFLKKNQDPRVFCAHVERILNRKRLLEKRAA